MIFLERYIINPNSIESSVYSKSEEQTGTVDQNKNILFLYCIKDEKLQCMPRRFSFPTSKQNTLSCQNSRSVVQLFKAVWNQLFLFCLAGWLQVP